jgi:hypothetical protein
MAEVVHDAQQDFWRPPSVMHPVEADLPSSAADELAQACSACGTEFMIGARFCHTCGLNRTVLSAARKTLNSDAEVMAGLWAQNMTWFSALAGSLATAWREIPFPGWLQYLHFHEIKRRVGLPTAALIAFIVGMGCVAGALGISFFYKASNLAEFQAIQMWRIEWLLAATASFVAGILLKKPSDR